VPDEDSPNRSRRRPLLLAMLVAAALLVALAGSGAVSGGGSSPSSDEGTGVTRDAPAAGQGTTTHRGRHCRHEGPDGQAPQQSPTEDPPV
jgi:hypothetical protein